MKTKFTKGSWDLSTSLGEIVVTGVSSDIALVNTGTSINYEEARANAKLIATAPELLESLTEMCEFYLAVSKHFTEAITARDMQRFANAAGVIKKATE